MFVCFKTKFQRNESIFIKYICLSADFRQFILLSSHFIAISNLNHGCFGSHLSIRTENRKIKKNDIYILFLVIRTNRILFGMVLAFKFTWFDCRYCFDRIIWILEKKKYFFLHLHRILNEIKWQKIKFLMCSRMTTNIYCICMSNHVKLTKYVWLMHATPGNIASAQHQKCILFFT